MVIYVKFYRTFYVKICNRFGPVTEITSGVPQGSVLGPFLFAAFMSRLSFNRADVHNVKYADDISIIEFVPHGQVGSISLEDCVSRFKQEGLFVNRSKCKQMCVRQCKPHDIVDDCGFDRVNVLKILGFTFMDTFKWNAQISDVLRRASQRLHIIQCLKNCMTTRLLTHIYPGVAPGFAPTRCLMCPTGCHKTKHIRIAFRNLQYVMVVIFFL